MLSRGAQPCAFAKGDTLGALDRGKRATRGRAGRVVPGPTSAAPAMLAGRCPADVWWAQATGQAGPGGAAVPAAGNSLNSLQHANAWGARMRPPLARPRPDPCLAPARPLPAPETPPHAPPGPCALGPPAAHQQGVGQLDVARDLALAVAIVQRQDELLEDEARQRLRHPAQRGGVWDRGSRGWGLGPWVQPAREGAAGSRSAPAAQPLSAPRPGAGSCSDGQPQSAAATPRAPLQHGNRAPLQQSAAATAAATTVTARVTVAEI